jgi:hypothetical protein
LPSTPPFILYVCSAPFLGSDPEAPFVIDWIERIRAHSSLRLSQAPILVRPHPARQREWEGVDVSAYGNVVVWGGNPVDARTRADYFDSLFHSAVVVGLNTSAFIEAGIVGRPVHTILLPKWHESQLGTVHFAYLFQAGGGLLVAARDFGEHLEQIDASLANPSTDVKPFVRDFVRPLGLDVPATPLFVEHVERMQSMPVQAPLRPRFRRLAMRALTKAIPWRDDASREQWVYSERELEGIANLRMLRQTKAQAVEDRRREKVALKSQRASTRQSRMERHRAAKKAAKVLRAPSEP